MPLASIVLRQSAKVPGKIHLLMALHHKILSLSVDTSYENIRYSSKTEIFHICVISLCICMFKKILLYQKSIYCIFCIVTNIIRRFSYIYNIKQTILYLPVLSTIPKCCNKSRIHSGHLFTAASSWFISLGCISLASLVLTRVSPKKSLSSSSTDKILNCSSIIALPLKTRYYPFYHHFKKSLFIYNNIINIDIQVPIFLYINLINLHFSVLFLIILKGKI